MISIINTPHFWYATGAFSTMLCILLWKLIYNLCLSHVVKDEIQKDIESLNYDSDMDKAALNHINDCKMKLIYQKTINPDWIEPLKTEIPSLLHNISCVYSPESKNPLLSPDISEFLYAIELVSNDITNFLHSKAGRILNVSGNTAHDTYKLIQNISANEKIQKLDEWYRKMRPLFQIVYYKSAVMWTFLIGRNIAIRTLQSKIINIVGMRAIQLYSGKLSLGNKGSNYESVSL